MKPNDLPEDVANDATRLPGLQEVEGRAEPRSTNPIYGVVLGELLALSDVAGVVIVRFPELGSARAASARSTVDLHGGHIGTSVLLMFERGDPELPIVTGVLAGAKGWPMADRPAQIDVDADGKRLVVNAGQQLVLRCGRASITLTHAGKVVIEGSYVVSRSTGMNRIKGGSIQLN
ncbi:MAG: DUF6484 domain-containing protein [Pseudomonadota bacterium]|nr:DUF6484 domain-containing protein [Pseudomonadota bacterium]